MAAVIELPAEAAATPPVELDPEKLYEIVDGQPEEKEMAGARHSGVGVRLITKLNLFVESNQLGGVYGPDATFLIRGNDRLPDVSFVSIARMPPEGEPEGKWEIAPDLAVEIVSPNDIQEKVSDKILDYLAVGVKQVWLISPKHRSVTIFRSQTDVQVFAGDSELVSEDLLPGFRCRLSDIFKSPTSHRENPQGS
jgi:Uma2 family endonuclease